MTGSTKKHLYRNPGLAVMVAVLSLIGAFSACSDIKKGQWVGPGDVAGADVEVVDVSDIVGDIDIDDVADGSGGDASTLDRFENDLGDADAPVDADVPIDADVTSDLDVFGDIDVSPSCSNSDDECAGQLILGQCQKPHCDREAGVCVPVAKDDDAPCDDQDPCTIGDECTSGVCVSGSPRDCDDTNPCTEDGCDFSGVCFHANLSVGTCDSISPCAINGVCIEGTCLSEPDPACTCEAPDWDCSAYDDGLVCNGVLICNQDPATPSCVMEAGSAIYCDSFMDSDCSKNLCAEAVGDCVMTPVREGLGCDDGDACSVGETCQSGICGGGFVAPCNDGDPCTIDDKCHNGLCHGTPYSCDDSVECTLDVCDGQGGCSHNVLDDACRIDGECFTVDSVNPLNSCEFCVPLASRIRWTLVPSDETETCNGNDDDCDGSTDEPGSDGCNDYFHDGDGDHYGASPSRTCLCAATAEYTVTIGGDCNDDDKFIRPNAVEACNGKDDDCDGVTDPENESTGGRVYYRDADHDGYGSGTDYKVLCAAGVEFSSLRNDDCDDGSFNTNPGATEYCNNQDDDCDGTKDEENAIGCVDYFYDKDGDGYGIGTPQCRCLGLSTGFYRARFDGDCDDNNVAVHPGVTEKCNGVDDNCNGSTDEEDADLCDDYYRDLDRDSFGDITKRRCLCGPILGTYDATNASDCCDSDGDVHPGQEAFFSTTNECGTYDYDCNGSDAKQWPDTGGCGTWTVTGTGCRLNRGWSASPVPECGVTAQWVFDGCGYITPPVDCDAPETQDKAQACR